MRICTGSHRLFQLLRTKEYVHPVSIVHILWFAQRKGLGPERRRLDWHRVCVFVTKKPAWNSACQTSRVFTLVFTLYSRLRLPNPARLKRVLEWQALKLGGGREAKGKGEKTIIDVGAGGHCDGRWARTP